jgi:hypothetical protein
MGNTTLWATQAIRALVCTAAGGAKVALAREQLATRTHRRLGEGSVPALVVGGPCRVVALGRLLDA